MELSITINGKRRFVRDRTTIFEACREAGVYVPHFCYHPKLSIAANCRMCLVQVEKAPKPLPACATYVTDGMVIHTNSQAAQDAQRGVMEFLLINHPLDCPICDQGGECQLQDLAVGYGASCTRYGEKKRVVVEKNLGPLINTVMTRCIHCTRCVRFGQEVAGQMELGMVGRGEHSEIMPFVESTVDSELSGNMVDICPVGALNSRPFRFSARTWELRRADGIAQHDSWGSNIELQAKGQLVKRVLPREHEDINECWISDRDRFSYTGLDFPGRLLEPHIRDADASNPRVVVWREALEEAASRLRQVIANHGPDEVGVLLGPGTTSEEALLAAQLIQGLGSENIDHRLRQTDFSLDGHEQGVPWLGCSIDELRNNDCIFLVGSHPARELPLLPVALRKAVAERQAAVSLLGARSLERQVTGATELLAPPSRWVAELARVLSACAADAADLPAWVKAIGPPEGRHHAIAARLQAGTRPAVLLGAQAWHSRSYGALRSVAAMIAKAVGGFQGQLVEGPNAVGMSLAGAVPHHGFMCAGVPQPGKDAGAMLDPGLKAYLLINCEPLDFADPVQAATVFSKAAVVSVGGYFDPARTYADVMLPAAQFAERKGATVSLEGNAATMAAAVDPPGDARPAWKVLRVLGELLGLDGFAIGSLDEVRQRLIDVGDFTRGLANGLDGIPAPAPVLAPHGGSYERLPETAHFAVDPVVRRAAPLQETRIARHEASATFHPDDLGRLGVRPGDDVELAVPGGATVTCPALADPALAPGCVKVPFGVGRFEPLGAATDVTVQAVAVAQDQAVAA